MVVEPLVEMAFGTQKRSAKAPRVHLGHEDCPSLVVKMGQVASDWRLMDHVEISWPKLLIDLQGKVSR